MKRIPITLAALLLAAGAISCGAAPPLDTRTFGVQHLEPQAAAEMISPYVYYDRPGAPGTLSLSEEGRTITVRERPDNLDRIARVLAERDRPRPAVSLHFQIIEAGADAAEPNPAIAEVEAALRDVLRFRGYRLLGSALVQAAERSEIHQRFALPGEHVLTGSMGNIQIRDDGSATARLSIRYHTGAGGLALQTTVNLEDGRTIVLGTAGGRGDDGALILAVRPVFQ